MLTRKTRYRVTVGQSESWRDTEPGAAELENIRHVANNRGYAWALHRCTTTLDPDAPTGQKVRFDDVYLDGAPVGGFSNPEGWRTVQC